MIKEKRKRKIQMIIVLSILYCILVLSIPSYADSIQSSKIFTGLKKLLEDAGKALVIIAPIVGGATVAYCFIRRAAADEMDHKKWTNRINTALVSTIGATVAGVIISVISSYFK